MPPESYEHQHPESAQPLVRNWDAAASGAVLIAPRSSDHKYRRGVVECDTGSSEYPGAARLSVLGAIRSGVGMVRYLNQDLAATVLAQFPEVVSQAGKTDAVLIGSGTPQASSSKTDPGAATVIDAGALGMVNRAAGAGSARRWILTPHQGEFAALEERLKLGGGSRSIRKRLRNLAAATQATVLLKGSSTVAASPDGELIVVSAQSWRLATAGSGDVLAGLIAGIWAQDLASGGSTPGYEIAATAAWLHQRAGVLASRSFAPDASMSAQAPIIASDLGAWIPRAIADALSAAA